MGAPVSSSHVVPAAAQGEESFLCPTMGSLPRRQFFRSSSSVSLSYRQQPPTNCCQENPFFTGSVPQGQAASALVPHRFTTPASKPGPRVGSSLYGSGGPSTGFPGGHSLFWASPCSSVGFLRGCSGSLHPHRPPWASGAQAVSW